MTKDQSAPGRLDRIRQFVNTIDFESGSDQLAGGEKTLAWCRAFGCEGPFSASDLDGLRALRESIRAVLLAHNGDGDLEEAWRKLALSGSGAAVVIELDAGGTARLVPAETAGSGVLRADLIAIIYDAVRDGTWRRLKACRKDTCLWAFYDHSKNGSGAWCSMAVCGNRAKAQRRRSRASEGR